MPADILPLLARAANVELDVATRDFEKQRRTVLKRRDGVDDSRTFYLAVEGFRAVHPFDLADLTMDRTTGYGADPRSTK